MTAFKPLTEQAEWDWVYSRARPVQCADSQGIVAYDERGIQAVAVIDGINSDSCNVHWAIDDPFVLRHGFMHEVCRHIFSMLGKERFFGAIPADNEKSLKFARNVGAREVSRIPDGYSTGVDYIVYRMDKEGCRWINHKKLEEVA
jgi:RimJ/RimL family protein N-acetyltransferase